MLELEMGLQDGKAGRGPAKACEAGREGCLDGVTKSSDCFTHSDQTGLPALVLPLTSQLVVSAGLSFLSRKWELGWTQ